MKIEVLGSGSSGNCIIVTDEMEHQIMLDCGLKYEAIITHINLQNLDCILLSHSHSDHTKGIEKFKNFYFNTISYENVEDGKLINMKYWKIIPMKLVHNVECFGYLIYNKIEDKKLVYITDTCEIPFKLPKNIDFMICECNYDEEVLYKFASIDAIMNKGYLNHLSKQTLLDYFDKNELYVKNLMLSHLSHSGLVDTKTLVDGFELYTNNVYLALPNAKIEF